MVSTGFSKFLGQNLILLVLLVCFSDVCANETSVSIDLPTNIEISYICMGRKLFKSNGKGT